MTVATYLPSTLASRDSKRCMAQRLKATIIGQVSTPKVGSHAQYTGKNEPSFGLIRFDTQQIADIKSHPAIDLFNSSNRFTLTEAVFPGLRI